MTYLLNSSVISVYLKGSISTIFNRLLIDKNKRPLISKIDESNLKEFIAKHLFERSRFYNKANHIVNIDSITTKQLVDRLELLTKPM
jgi:shikimate kinase